VGEVANEILSSQRVVPRKALALGYRFRFPDLDAALRDLLR
jgi:NAD dependent epimerase/dehydratase family enzyme